MSATSDESPAADYVTVTDAAERLRVTVPRLRRLLARAEFAGLVVIKTHTTRTGARPAHMLPVSALADLAALLPDLPGSDTTEAERSDTGNENEPERIDTENRNEAERKENEPEQTETGELRPAKDTPEVLYLRERLTDALQMMTRQQELLAREQQAHSETRRLLAAHLTGLIGPVERSGTNENEPEHFDSGGSGRQEGPQEAIGSPTEGGAEAGGTLPDATETRRRAWWRFW